MLILTVPHVDLLRKTAENVSPKMFPQSCLLRWLFRFVSGNSPSSRSIHEGWLETEKQPHNWRQPRDAGGEKVRQEHPGLKGGQHKSLKPEKQAHHIPRVVPRLKLPELPWVLPRQCETSPQHYHKPRSNTLCHSSQTGAHRERGAGQMARTAAQ